MLLILAGVSLNALVGENGIMENAKTASKEWNEKAAEESAELDSLTWNKYLEVTEVPKPIASIESGNIGNDGWYKGAEVKIKLTQEAGYTDKIEKMTYKINGTQGTTGEETIENGEIITITQDGINTITAWIYDKSGNPSDPEIIRIKKDSTAPVFSGLSTVDVNGGQTFDFESGVTVKDDASGVVKVNGKDFTYSPSTLSYGSNTITYTATDNAGNVTTQTRIVKRLITSIVISPTNTSIAKGSNIQLNITNGVSNELVNWSSLDTSIATVDQNGKVTASSSKTGTVKIRCTAKDNNEVYAECDVSVYTSGGGY